MTYFLASIKNRHPTAAQKRQIDRELKNIAPDCALTRYVEHGTGKKISWIEGPDRYGSGQHVNAVAQVRALLERVMIA
jgi:hypothetical protein